MSATVTSASTRNKCNTIWSTILAEYVTAVKNKPHLYLDVCMLLLVVCFQFSEDNIRGNVTTDDVTDAEVRCRKTHLRILLYWRSERIIHEPACQHRVFIFCILFVCSFFPLTWLLLIFWKWFVAAKGARASDYTNIQVNLFFKNELSQFYFMTMSAHLNNHRIKGY